MYLLLLFIIILFITLLFIVIELYSVSTKYYPDLTTLLYKDH